MCVCVFDQYYTKQEALQIVWRWLEYGKHAAKLGIINTLCRLIRSYICIYLHNTCGCTCNYIILFIVNMTKLDEPERERGIKFCTEFTAESC